MTDFCWVLAKEVHYLGKLSASNVIGVYLKEASMLKALEGLRAGAVREGRTISFVNGFSYHPQLGHHHIYYWTKSDLVD
jgi:hypothetical protein